MTHPPPPRLLATLLAATTAATIGAAASPALADEGHDLTRMRVLLPAATAPVATATLMPTPRPAVTLPATLDARPRYVGPTSCDPTDRPGSVALGRLLVDTYGTGRVGISRYCDGTTSEHHEGRAVDWMLDAANPSQKAVADSFLSWLVADDGAMARRMGIQYVIWNRHMWRAYDPARGWAPYSGASPHTDHIHVSLTWDGAMGRTSWWSGTAVTTLDVGTCRVYAGQPAPLYTARRTTPCPTALPAPPPSRLPVLAIGSRDRANVVRGQQALGVTADGVFGRGTQRALLAYQRAHALPTSGVFDKATWNRLVPDTPPTPVPAPAPTPAPAPSPAPAPVVVPPTAPRTSPTTVVRVPATVTRPLRPHLATTLRPGASGPAVRALQRALRVPVTGRHDRRTVAAVERVQARWRVPVTGVVDRRTWSRVELTRYPWLGYTSTTLRRGTHGPAVRALQQALGVRPDGSFGAVTARAVGSVQRAYGLPVTTVVDAATWRAISHAAR